MRCVFFKPICFSSSKFNPTLSQKRKDEYINLLLKGNLQFIYSYVYVVFRFIYYYIPFSLGYVGTKRTLKIFCKIRITLILILEVGNLRDSSKWFVNELLLLWDNFLSTHMHLDIFSSFKFKRSSDLQSYLDYIYSPYLEPRNREIKFDLFDPIFSDSFYVELVKLLKDIEGVKRNEELTLSLKSLFFESGLPYFDPNTKISLSYFNRTSLKPLRFHIPFNGNEKIIFIFMLSKSLLLKEKKNFNAFKNKFGRLIFFT